MLWEWIRANLWAVAGLATVLNLVFSWAFDRSTWWAGLDGRLKVLVYSGGALVLVGGSYGLALWAGQSAPDVADLAYTAIAAVVSLVGGPLSHEVRKNGRR